MPTLLAESYLHGLDPFALRFTERFGIRWYGLSYAAGFFIAWGMIRWMARTGRSAIPPASVGDLMFYIIAGVLVGGRVGYALFYDPSLFVGFGPDLPFWSLLALNQGGMASHGGMLGVIAACWIFAHRHGISRLHLFDVVALVCTPGLFLGRVANFVNGELWGRALPAAAQADPPGWSVKYPEEILLWRFDHIEDVARLDALEPLRTVVGGDATFLDSVVQAARAGQAEVVETVRPLLTAFYPSQLIQALTDGPILLGALVLVWLGPRRPGIVGSWFLFVYGALRIASEGFRQPDAGVGLLLGLSRGQVLSVLMIVVGVVAIPICSRRDVEPMGGLLRPAAAGKGVRNLSSLNQPSSRSGGAEKKGS